MDWAIISLPVPLSPRINTLESEDEATLAVVITSLNWILLPIISLNVILALRPIHFLIK
jgi:hypothetical protein